MSSRPNEDTPVRTDGGTSTSTANWAALGVASYLVFSLGITVMLYLTSLLVDAIGDPGGMGSGAVVNLPSEDMLEFAVQIGASQTVSLSIVIAVAVGLLIGRAATRYDSAPVGGALAAGLGALVSLVVMLVLSMVLDLAVFTQGADDLPGELAGIVGVTIGSAIAGAVAAGVGDASIS